MTRPIGFAALMCVVTLVGPYAQQQAPPAFRARVDLVPLDVSVLDRNRKPIRGLTKADFTVFEDGRPQEIAVFEAIDVPDPVPPPVAWMRDVTPDVTTNEVSPSRLWVIAIDDALMPSDAFYIKSSRQIVLDILDKFGPQDLVSIVFTTDSRRAQDFTNDRTKLLKTLDGHGMGMATWYLGSDNLNQRDPDIQFMLGSINTMLSVMDAFVEVPHTRKSLIWITPGIPHDVEVAIGPIKAPTPKDSYSMIGADGHRRILDLTKDLFDLARRANVPVYPIDPGGVDGLRNWLAATQRPTVKATWSMDHILTTAANTGGDAVVNTTDFKPGIDSIFEENKSYYLVGYYPANSKTDGTQRQLEVKVNREDANVRTRSSYFAPKPGDGPPKSTNDTLQRAIARPVAVNDLPLRATVAPFAIPGQSRSVAVAIALGVRQPVPESAAKQRVTVTTELRTTAFTTEGDNKGSQRHTAKVTLRAGAQGDADYEALSRIDLPPGRYRLRIAAHHTDAAKTGTVMVDVVVPDFSRDAASISGVILGASPGRPSAPRDLFSSILPLLPTAQREFAKSENVTALFYLYQLAGRPLVAAQLSIRIVDVHDAALIKESQTIDVDRFVAARSPDAPRIPTTGGRAQVGAPVAQPQRPDPGSIALRAAEVQYPLPISQVPPGRYLLTFEATIGGSVLRRDVQFSIR